MKVVDLNGSWFINRGQFPFHDPDSDTRFEPGVPTKATATEWLKGQTVIQPTEVEADKPVTAPVKPAKEPKTPKA